MRDYWSFAFLIIFILLGAYGEAIEEGINNQGVKVEHNPETASLKQQIDAEVLALAQLDLTLPIDGFRLDILSTDFSLPASDVHRMLARAHGESHPMIYSLPNIGTYTMSAQALDQDHYLVNTYLEGYAPFEVSNVMTPLFVLSQRKHYQFDAKQYAGREDVWQSSRQAFYYPRGDCEDHAIVLADWLIEKGEDARVVLGEVEGNGGHAWVILFKHGKEFLLEATQKDGLSRAKSYPAAVLYRDYHPHYMFNRVHFWENTGTKYTTNYSNIQWEKKSRYSITAQQSRGVQEKAATATH